jgi:hypothetical protein
LGAFEEAAHMMITARISNLENDPWEPVLGPDINPVDADTWQALNTPAGLVLSMMSTQPYGGWLAKRVSPLVFAAPRILFGYTMMIDDATPLIAQVAETDTKITDDQGWTYDLSAQWNIANGWMFQVDNQDWTWIDTGIQIPAPAPLEDNRIEIEYQIDYQTHTSSIVSVSADGERYAIDPEFHHIRARQVGWARNEIVSQLQQCNNATPGGYSLRFREIGYLLG